MDFKKIAIILAAVFIIGLTAATVYSRGYAEARKPFVALGTTEPMAFTYSINKVAYVAAANDHALVAGFTHMFEVTINEEDYAQVGEFLMVAGHPVIVIVEEYGFAMNGNIVRRVDTDGDIHVTIGFNGVAARPPSIGVKADIRFSWQTQTFHLLPLTAVHHDPIANEHYVYIVERVDGTWGREFVLRRQNAALWFQPILMGHYVLAGGFDKPVAVDSDGEIYNGAVVRIFR